MPTRTHASFDRSQGLLGRLVTVVSFPLMLILLASSAEAQASLRLLRGDNQPLDPARDSAPVSRRITNDSTLTREAAFHATSDDEDVRVELRALPPETVIESVIAESVNSAGAVRDQQALTWTRGEEGSARTSFLRLVGDAIDRSAESSTNHTLRVALGDQVRFSAKLGETPLSVSFRVGLIDQANSPFAARFGRVRALILRMSPGGVPVVGKDDASAIALLRQQIEGANQVWLQCYVSFGDAALAEVVVVDPPPPSLLAIADGDGLPARGGGSIRLRANNVAIDGGVTRAGASPVETAAMVAAAIRRAGFAAIVTENPAAEFGAGRSADIVVRDKQDKLVTLSSDNGAALSSDRQQSIVIGQVDLSDGLSEFNNMTASAGSLEERALLKAIVDNDPSTIDIVVVNRFAFGTRQGEAFIRSGGGPIHNVVVLDRTGLRQQHTAFALPHELGHVLLNQPYHPDNVGPDAPWLLMDADSNGGTVTGPKRLTWDECHRVRHQSADGLPQLLTTTLAPTPAPPLPRPTRSARTR